MGGWSGLVRLIKGSRKVGGVGGRNACRGTQVDRGITQNSKMGGVGTGMHVGKVMSVARPPYLLEGEAVACLDSGWLSIHHQLEGVN